MVEARKSLAAEYGEDALVPWNIKYYTSGMDIEQQLDPYFPFGAAVSRWARSFAELGVDFKGASMQLDPLAREEKPSRGLTEVLHPAWRKSDGSLQPARIQISSNADPAAIGSGKEELKTLMHEAGHAAHYANVDQGSPLFGDIADSVCETQSKFFDFLVDSAAWRARYAENDQGEVLPWELHEEQLRSSHPYAVLELRRELAVPYFEKRLYELPDEDVTTERIKALADEIEKEIEGGPSARSLVSLLTEIHSSSTSCYYHSYLLGEMAVHQTQDYFRKKDGFIVDNPRVGEELTKKYWKPGGGETFLDMVNALTGSRLSADACVENLTRPLEELVAKEKAEYDAGIARRSSDKTGDEDDLNMNFWMRVTDGEKVIADSEADGGFSAMNEKFKVFVANRVQATAKPW
jgi:hypothetical protein